MPRPDLNRVPEFYHGYIKKVKEDDLLTAMRNCTSQLEKLLNSIPAEKLDFRYAEGKWTVKEVVQHMIDAERVFTYRALRFARKDATPLPGFDENSYTENSLTEQRQWNDLINEFLSLRKASEILFASFNNDQLESEGIASGHSIYVLGIGFICAGHVNHHCDILKERYLQ